MEKLDLVKKHKTYYTAKATPMVVEIEEAKFLSILGKGDPSSEDFALKVQALYTVAYTLKFACKAKDMDFVVAKLEGLWWFDDEQYGGLSMEEAPVRIPRSEWSWRLLIRMPDYVREGDVQRAIDAALKKKDVPYADEVALFELREGKSVQMLHVGPFDEEPRTLKLMREFMEVHKLSREVCTMKSIYLISGRRHPPDSGRYCVSPCARLHIRWQPFFGYGNFSRIA
jgi:hypothetical protein